jgi:hypothetical protein
MKIIGIGLMFSAMAFTMISQSVPAAAKTVSHNTGKPIHMYQAAICHMYFTPAQAKKYHYACPISKGKMHPVMVSPAVAQRQSAKTEQALASAAKSRKAK